MRVKLPLDKTVRTEIHFEKPSIKIKNLQMLDTLVCSAKAQALVINPDFLPDMNIIKCQRNSQYKLITYIDIEGKVFGGNKVYKIQNLIEADGFDIGLTANKNEIELSNEIKSITSFLQQYGNNYLIRWVINTKHGIDHIKNCLNAIKRSKSKYDMIVIDTNKSNYEISLKHVENCRKELGLLKCKMKVDGDPIENLINDDKNLYFKVNADEL